jgi:hypothetical protein
MLRDAQLQVEHKHLTGTEYVLNTEVWGAETPGIHDDRGRSIDLTIGTNTLYCYRVTTVERPPAEFAPSDPHHRHQRAVVIDQIPMVIRCVGKA